MKHLKLSLPAPYVGLRSFAEDDALLFFGRSAHVADLLSRLERNRRFVAVLGPSGSGKSSLVRAGLVPALHRGALEDAGHRWNVCIFKPGDTPIGSLARELAEDTRWLDGDDTEMARSALRAALTVSPRALADLYRERSAAFEGEALLLVVDQFEEMFRYRQRHVDEAEAFVRLLLRSATEEVPIYVVITMRSDFLGNCVTFIGLPEMINDGLYLTPRLDREQLKSVIASPLALVGGSIDPLLVNQLVNGLQGDDELPVLEHALLRMWNQARDYQRSSIEAKDFAAVCVPSGGTATHLNLSYAIDIHASEIYRSLSEVQRSMARRLFLSLVTRRDGREVRSPQRFGKVLEYAGSEWRADLLRVVDAFRAGGVGFLLPATCEEVHDDTVIDISHESLMRQWSVFRGWLDEEELDCSELQEWQRRAARQREGGGWLDEEDGKRADVWRQRVSARWHVPAWAARYVRGEQLGAVDRYLDGSVERQRELRLQEELAALAHRDREFAEKLARRAVAGVIGLSLLVVIVLILAYQAVQQRRRAEALTARARAGEILAVAESVLQSNPGRAALLVLEAYQVDAGPHTEPAVRQMADQYAYQRVLWTRAGSMAAAQFSPDGLRVITASEDGTARLWSVSSGQELGALRGHEDRLMSAQFSPDGKRVVTGSRDGTARLWSVSSGQVHVLRSHKREVVSAQFSPDGERVVTASRDGTARLWSVSSGQELRVLRGHEGAVLSAGFSPDGERVVTASLDKTARLWSVSSGQALRVLRGHERSVSSAQFSPDGERVVTASLDETARLWSVSSGQALQVLHGHEGPVSSAQFSPDGKGVVTASLDKTARLWSVPSGQELRVLRGHEGVVLSAGFSPDGERVVTASLDKTARLWSVSSGQELRVLRGDGEEVLSAQFSLNGEHVVTAGADGGARLWSVSGEQEPRVLRGHGGEVVSAQFSPDGRRVVTASWDKTAWLWSVSSGRELRVLRGHEEEVVSAQFSPDGQRVVTASWDKTARLWSVSSGQELRVLRGHERSVSGAQFSAEGERVVTASWDGTARLWSVSSGQELQVLRGHEGVVSSAQFSPDGACVVTASLDRTARLWSVSSGQALQVLRGHEAAVSSAQFSPDGGRVVTTGADGTARLWSVSSGQELRVLRGHEGSVSSVQFSADGERVITTGADGTARLWSVASGQELQVLRGHERSVSSAQFSADGQRVVTASWDGTARLWSVSSGQELQVLRGHEGAVVTAEFSPNGQTVATASSDSTVRIWTSRVSGPIADVIADLRSRIGRTLTAEERRRFGVEPAGE